MSRAPRCKHLNGELSEETTLVTSYDVVVGERDPVGWHSAGGVRLWTFECSDCEQMFQTRNPEKTQKWFRKLIPGYSQT
jgi:hypothetical protein